MFQRIIVPLDGSNRAEQAIPVAASIARVSGGSVVLLRVAPMPVDLAWQWQAPLIVPDVLAEERAVITEYLLHLASSEALKGVPTVREVADGVPAQTILAVARAQQADLIVMCSHGRTGITRRILGSVAQTIARQSTIPVLILREGAAGRSEPSHLEDVHPVRVMVALDGSSLAEEALAPAVHLSIALSAPKQGEVHLVRVLPLSLTEEMTDIQRTQAITEATVYLETVEQRLRRAEGEAGQFQVISSVVIDASDIAGALTRVAQRSEEGEEEEVDGSGVCDVIALATHGRGGWTRLVAGSITERVLEATRLPVLVVRPQQMERRRKKIKESAEAEHRLLAGVRMPSTSHKYTKGALRSRARRE